jgi:hypothetical protein
MRTFVGAAALVLLGLSPWILPSIAVAAAKMTREEARGACRGELAQDRAGERGHGHGDGRAQDCIDAKLADWKWPWQ